ncbi:Na+/H+ antiporter subunit E [Aeromicrobium sp. CF3.5]|uniref:Na+/H+ antiporter subunit E n=1 Tax=Aeromicrobium sp. CF3.5 TaxID=3373078 RepID=UPI003EE6CBE4
MRRLGPILGLTALWMLLWGDITALLLVGGLLVATAVVVVFPFPQGQWQGVFRPWQFAVLLGRFVVDLVSASLQVAWLALRPQPLGPSAVVEVQLHTRSELLMVLTSELISLVPGSLLIELDAEQGKVWLHVLDAGRDLDSVIERALVQERRVIDALGSDAERAAYCTSEVAS